MHRNPYGQAPALFDVADYTPTTGATTGSEYQTTTTTTQTAQTEAATEEFVGPPAPTAVLDPFTPVALSSSTLANLKSAPIGQSTWVKYKRLEKAAEGGYTPSDAAVAEAMDEIRAAQIARAEQLQAEGRLDEAIALLGLSPADAAAALSQDAQEAEATLTAEELAAAQAAEDAKRTQKLMLLALLVVGSAGVWYWRTR